MIDYNLCISNVSFPCCLYKKRDKSGIDEGTAIYFNPSGVEKETKILP